MSCAGWLLQLFLTIIILVFLRFIYKNRDFDSVLFFVFQTSSIHLFFNFSCDSDYVILSGGERSEKFCGQKLPHEYVSKDNVVGVRFVSTSHENQQKPGFVATYTSGLAGIL